MAPSRAGWSSRRLRSERHSLDIRDPDVRVSDTGLRDSACTGGGRTADAGTSLAGMSAPRRLRLLVLNQYYWPGIEATAQLLTELCEALAEDMEVTVVTGVLHGHEDEPRRAARGGVEIIRVVSTSFERSKLLARGANYASYLAAALF